MLHKWMLLSALILLSLVVAPIGAARADTIRGNTNNYEPDNTFGQARVITSGSSQTRAISPETDLDWVKFQLTVQSAIVLETSGPYYSDTRIRLYQLVNQAPVEMEISDDQGPGKFSQIDRTCVEDPLPAGTYFVRVEEYGTDAEIPSYDLFFQSSPCPSELVEIFVGAEREATSVISLHESTRRSIARVNNGPVQIANSGASPLMAAERVIYSVNGVNTSFSEMMALPNNQLDTKYWFPWYNNVELDTQLRFANISGLTASVQVFIGGVEMVGSPFTLAAGASIRKSFTGINNGPVLVMSTQNIIAAERVIYKVNGVNTSFSEMMGVPGAKLDTTYWLPWYNNKELDTQLRIANVSNIPASVRVYIGNAEMPGSPFPLAVGASIRKSYPGVNNGPVRIVSDQQIVAAERVIYKVNNINTSFSETMGLPNNMLETKYWLPWYNNTGDLDTQLRIANVSSLNATIHVYIGGKEVSGSPFAIPAGGSTRKSFFGVSSGPVQILSDQNIVAAERVLYKVNNVSTSFSEMMALPNSQLNTIFWLPWYNNLDLDTQLRFGIP